MKASKHPAIFRSGRACQGILEDLEAALEQFREIAVDLAGRYQTRK